jgi:hypothetical protein
MNKEWDSASRRRHLGPFAQKTLRKLDRRTSTGKPKEKKGPPTKTSAQEESVMRRPSIASQTPRHRPPKNSNTDGIQSQTPPTTPPRQTAPRRNFIERGEEEEKEGEKGEEGKEAQAKPQLFA